MSEKVLNTESRKSFRRTVGGVMGALALIVSPEAKAQDVSQIFGELRREAVNTATDTGQAALSCTLQNVIGSAVGGRGYYNDPYCIENRANELGYERQRRAEDQYEQERRIAQDRREYIVERQRFCSSAAEIGVEFRTGRLNEADATGELVMLENRLKETIQTYGAEIGQDWTTAQFYGADMTDPENPVLGTRDHQLAGNAHQVIDSCVSGETYGSLRSGS